MSPTRMRLLIAAAIVLPAIALADAPTVVNQINRAFAVRAIHIARGTIVRFVNADEFLHHVYVDSPNFKFNSGEQEPGTNVDVAFPVSGTFDVRCEIHPRMLLHVTVD